MPDLAPASRGGLSLAFRNREVRAVQLGWTAGVAADAGFLVVGLVVAYEAAGAIGVGLLGLARMVPATLVALFADPGRRLRPEQTLVMLNIVRLVAVAIGLIAVASDSGSRSVAIFAVSAVIAGVTSLSRPAQSVLIPSLVTEPAELVGANVATSAGESVGTFLGTMLVGLALAASNESIAALVCLLGFGGAVMATASVRVSDAARPVRRSDATGFPLVAGVHALRARGAAAAILAAVAAQVVVRGLLTTLIVVAALELLLLGEPGVGGLNAAIGAGGIGGAIVTLALARRRRLAPIFALSLVGWGVPIMVVGIVPIAPMAFAMMGVLGLSNVVLDVVAYTLLQRAIPGRDRPAVFALLEGGIGIGLASGGLLAPVLITIAGVQGALIVTGVVLPIVAILTWHHVRRIDDEDTIPDLVAAALRADRILRRLPITALERVASDASAVAFEPGEALMREGEPGDRYLVITSGRVEVTERGVVRRQCGPGEGVGEIALLRSTPRTATVVALERTQALAVTSLSFLAAMTGHEPSGAIAQEVMEERLAQVD